MFGKSHRELTNVALGNGRKLRPDASAPWEEARVSLTATFDLEKAISATQRCQDARISVPGQPHPLREGFNPEGAVATTKHTKDTKGQVIGRRAVLAQLMKTARVASSFLFVWFVYFVV